MMIMARYSRNRREKDRAKAQWELVLNPTVTMIVVAFCVGILLVWIGMFENKVNPGDGVITTEITDVCDQISDFVQEVTD